MWAVEAPPGEGGKPPNPVREPRRYYGGTGLSQGTAVTLCLQIPVAPASSPAATESVRVCSGRVTHGDAAQTVVMTAAAAPCSHPQVRSPLPARAPWWGEGRPEQAGGPFIKAPLAHFITAHLCPPPPCMGRLRRVRGGILPLGCQWYPTPPPREVGIWESMIGASRTSPAWSHREPLCTVHLGEEAEGRLAGLVSRGCDS